MKFRIHAFEDVRRVYEIEAESMEEASAKVDEVIGLAEPIESEFTGDFSREFLIDPILSNGGVDFDNAKWFGGDDIIATSTSESLARFTVFAHNNMPALLEAVECLQDVKDWLTTGKVDGVGFDQNAVIDAVSTVLEKLK
jgi:hypothetical protein